MEPIRPDLTIVYEKYTEEAANFISGSLASKYTCVVQKDTVFESKKYEYTNNNRILFLSEDLIRNYLRGSKLTEYVIKDDDDLIVYSLFYTLGNWCGIQVDKEKTIKTLPKRDRFYYYAWKYYGDFFIYPFIRKRASKEGMENWIYIVALKYFLKDENIKLIFPD